jgi:hypothetical protein
LNAHATNEYKCDGSNDGFNQELQQVFDQFPKYHMKILLRFLIEKWGEGKFSDRQLGMRAFDSVGREVLYNFLIQFGIHMKLAKLIRCV